MIFMGDAVGDEAIRAVAVGTQRSHPLVGRLGGDEFGVLLPEHSLVSAVAAAEALRRTFAGLSLKTEGGRAKLTCSFGVSEWQLGDSIDDLIRRSTSLSTAPRVKVGTALARRRQRRGFSRTRRKREVLRDQWLVKTRRGVDRSRRWTFKSAPGKLYEAPYRVFDPSCSRGPHPGIAQPLFLARNGIRRRLGRVRHPRLSRWFLVLWER